MYTIRALRRFTGQFEGNVPRGATVPNLTRDRAYELVSIGVAEILEGSDDLKPGFETKEGQPSNSATSPAPVFSSPAANPLDPQTSVSPPDGPSAASMTGSTSIPPPPPSTPPIAAGGKSTTKKSERSAKPTDGARTAKRVGTLTSSGSNPTAPPGSLGDPAISTPAPSGTAAPKR